MIVRPYSPKEIVNTWGGITIFGYAPGSMVNIAMAENDYEMVAGAQGDVVIVRNLNPIGSVTVRLQAESPTNSLLSSQAVISRKFAPIVRPFMMKNLGGDTIVKSAFSIVQKLPDIDAGAEAGVREWIFLCADLDMFVGSQNALI